MELDRNTKYLLYHLNISFLKRRLFEYGDGQYWHSMMNTMNVYTKRVELSQHLLGINKKGHYPYLIPEEIMLHWHHLHIISAVLLTKGSLLHSYQRPQSSFSLMFIHMKFILILQARKKLMVYIERNFLFET